MTESKEKIIPPEVHIAHPMTLEAAIAACLGMQSGDLRIFLLDEKPPYRPMKAAHEELAKQTKLNPVPTIRPFATDNKWYLVATCLKLGTLIQSDDIVKSLITAAEKTP